MGTKSIDMTIPTDSKIMQNGHIHSSRITEDRLTEICTGAIFTSIGTLTTILRILVVRLGHRTFSQDDLVMHMAYIAMLGFAIGAWLGIWYGVGLIVTVEPDIQTQETLVKILYAVEIFYCLAVYLTKMSLLFLYLRLGNGVAGLFNTSTMLTMILLTAHFTTSIFVIALQCVPILHYWNPTAPGFCIDMTAFFFSTNVFTIVTDIIVLVLPLSTVWSIQRPMAQRLGLCAIFLVGGLSTVASCVRLSTIKPYTEASLAFKLRNAAPLTTWSFIEVNLGILSASAPAIKPLFTRNSGKDGCIPSSAIGIGRRCWVRSKNRNNHELGREIAEHSRFGMCLGRAERVDMAPDDFVQQRPRPQETYASRQSSQGPARGSEKAYSVRAARCESLGYHGRPSKDEILVSKTFSVIRDCV